MQRVGLRDPESARREILASDAAQSRVVKRLSGYDWQELLMATILSPGFRQVGELQ